MNRKMTMALMAVAVLAIALTALFTVVMQDETEAVNNDDYFVVDGIRYQITGSDTVSVAPLESGKYESQDALVIPATVKNGTKTYNVTGIADETFMNAKSLNAVAFSEGLETIGESAFEGSSIVQEVIFPSTLKTIGERAFYRVTMLKGIDISKTSVEEIPENAFNGCTQVKYIKFNDKLKTIGEAAFGGCSKITEFDLEKATSLETIGDRAFQNIGTADGIEVTIVASVTSMGDSTFSNAKVTAYTVMSGNAAYKSVDGCILSKDGKKLLFYPIANKQTSFTIPSSVEELTEDAFYSAQNLTTLTIDNSVKFEDALTMSSIEHMVVTQSASLPQGYGGIIKTYFTSADGYWSFSNITVTHLTIDSEYAVDLGGVKAKSGDQYIDFTAKSKNTVNGNFTKDGSPATGAARAGERFTSAATGTASDKFEYDNARIMTVVVSPKEGGDVAYETKVERGATASFTATAKSGFAFSYWNDDKTKTNPTYSFTVTDDTVVTANFVMIENCYYTVPTKASFQMTTVAVTEWESGVPSSYPYPIYKNVDYTDKKDNSDGTTTYVYILPNGDYVGVVTGSEYVTYMQSMTKKSNQEINVTVKESQLKPEGKSQTYVDRSVVKTGGDDIGGILVSGNLQNHIYLSKGQVRDMMVYRQWQTTESAMAKVFLEPEIVYTITDLEGNPVSNVLTITPGGPGETTWKLKGDNEGTVVVTVWKKAFTAKIGQELFYGATWPELTQVFVVTVGSENKFDTGMIVYDEALKKDRAIDCDIDYFYYDWNDDGYAFTFTPASGTTVSVYNPILGDNGIEGFKLGTATKSGDSWTVLLTEGRNIVKMENDGKVMYQVLMGMPVRIIINGVDSSDAVLIPGQSNTVVFRSTHGDYGGIFNSKSKLLGIYNSGATIYYADETGERVATAKQPGYGHYFFVTASEFQTLTFTVPADWDITKEYAITPHGIVLSGFDGTHGDHRTWFQTVFTNLEVKRASFLPDISVRVQGSVAECELSNDGGASWKEYNSFAKAVSDAKNGSIIKVNKDVMPTKVTKDIEIRMGGHTFLDSGSALVIAADVSLLGIKPVPYTVFLEYDSHLTVDTTCEIMVVFPKAPVWVGEGSFLTGITADWVSVQASGYTAYNVDTKEVGLIESTKLPFGVVVDDVLYFYGDLTTAVSHLADDNIVYVLSYQPLYTGGKAVNTFYCDDRLSEDIMLKTIVRVTDGTHSTYYVDGKYFDDNGAILELPAVENLSARLEGTINLDGGCTLNVCDVIVVASIQLGGGMGTASDIATVNLVGDVPQYRMSIGFDKIADWSIIEDTPEGKVYKLKDGCDYTFITSEKVSLNDRVGVNAAGFKANIQPGGHSAKLVASSDMVAYIKSGADSFTGYTSVEEAMKAAGPGGTIYILYRTTNKPGDADVTSHIIDFDMTWQPGYKFDTVHQEVSEDGSTSQFIVDSKVATLVMSDGHYMLVKFDADFTRIYVEGTVKLTGEARIDLGQTAPANSVSALTAYSGMTVLDVTDHLPGLIVRNVGTANIVLTMPEETEDIRYYTYMIGNDLYFDSYTLSIQQTNSGEVTIKGADGMVITLKAGDQSITRTIVDGQCVFNGLIYTSYDMTAELDGAKFHDSVFLVIVNAPNHAIDVPMGTTALTIKGAYATISSGYVPSDLYYDSDGLTTLVMPDKTVVHLKLPMHSFTEVTHDHKVFDHCDCGYEVYLRDEGSGSGGDNNLTPIIIGVAIAAIVVAAVLLYLWKRGMREQ